MATELEQANRYRFHRDHVRFVARCAARRLILCDRLGLAPADLRILEGQNGKPSVAAEPAVAFSASHSSDLALLAVISNSGRAPPIGVDLEVLRPVPDAARLAELYGSNKEREDIREEPFQQRASLFLRYWTVKEAWLKATGVGIAVDLASLRVRLLSDSDALLSEGAQGKAHSIVSFCPRLGYLAALASTAGRLSPTCHDFDWSAAETIPPIAPERRRHSGPT